MKSPGYFISRHHRDELTQEDLQELPEHPLAERHPRLKRILEEQDKYPSHNTEEE